MIGTPRDRLRMTPGGIMSEREEGPIYRLSVGTLPRTSSSSIVTILIDPTRGSWCCLPEGLDSWNLGTWLEEVDRRTFFSTIRNDGT